MKTALGSFVSLADRRVLRLCGGISVPGAVPARVYRSVDGLSVVLSDDETEHGNLRHVSLAYPDREPSWQDVRLVRQAFFPMTADAMLVLPRPALDMQGMVHPYCLHLWQTPEAWMKADVSSLLPALRQN